MCGAPGSMGRLYALAVAVAAVLVREAAGVGTRGGAKLVKGGKQRESLYTKEALADEVLTLPGAEALDITFNQFSGEPIVLGRRQRSFQKGLVPENRYFLSPAIGCDVSDASYPRTDRLCQAMWMWAGASSCTTGSSSRRTSPTPTH